MGTRGKLMPFDGRYELPTNLRNFTQKNLTKVKIFQKVLGATFSETLCITELYSTKGRTRLGWSTAERFVSYFSTQ